MRSSHPSPTPPDWHTQVLVYDGRSLLNDLPQGDLDDLDEKEQWRKDLNDYAHRKNTTGNEAAKNSA